VTTATVAKTNATNAVNTVTTQLNQAKTDKGRADALLAKLNTALKPLTDAVTVAKHLKKIQEDLKNV
jgi:hypothetical protein